MEDFLLYFRSERIKDQKNIFDSFLSLRRGDGGRPAGHHGRTLQGPHELCGDRAWSAAVRAEGVHQ